MEIIGMGILLAVGFYIAPYVILAVATVAAMIIGGIASLFSSK